MKKIIYLTIFAIGLVGINFFLSNSVFLSTREAEICSKKDNYGEKITCWEKLLENTVSSKGVESGFDLFLHLYENYPEFSKSCHDYTHIIGEKAYSEYSKHGEVDVTPETSYCGYGFYHGFIIAMMAREGNISKSSEFCDYANRRLKEKVPGIALDCYHGIGHGATDFVLDNKVGLKANQTMIDNSLDICEEVARNENELSRCVDGVYHALTEVNIESSGLFSKDDPFKLCRTQPKKYQKECHGSLAFLIMQFNENDFKRAVEEVETLQNEEYAQALIRQLSGYQGYRTVDSEDNTSEILVCRSLQERLSKECFKGLIEGLTDFGKPGEEHVKILSFCSNSAMTSEEGRFCLNHAVNYFDIYFGNDRKEELCSFIETADSIEGEESIMCGEKSQRG